MKTCARLLFSISLGLLLPACASIHTDHFYALQRLPAGEPAARDQFAREMTVRLSVPSIVDRNQFILRQGNGVILLEHERWASPLAEQLTRVLGQDIEQRRPDILITARPISQAEGVPRASVQVDVVDLTLRRTGPVTLEARWHLDSPGSDGKSGRESFSATPSDTSAGALATGVSQCLADLADRLATMIDSRTPST